MRQGCMGAFLLCGAIACAGAAQAAGKAHAVRIEGMKYIPERLEVAAGDTITWTNKDIVPHSVTSVESKVESGDLTMGKSWKFTAANKGAMAYVCRLHPVMKGEVIVK